MASLDASCVYVEAICLICIKQHLFAINNNFESKFAIRFYFANINRLQQGTTGMTTTVLEVTNPSHHNNSMNHQVHTTHVKF